MRWLPPRPYTPRTASQPRSSAQRGSRDLSPEDSHISSNWENIDASDLNDNTNTLQEAIQSQYNAAPRRTNQLAMGDGTLSDKDDLILAIYAEEELGWRNSVETEPTAPRNHLGIFYHFAGESLPNRSTAWTQNDPNTHNGEHIQAAITATEAPDLILPDGQELPTEITLSERAAIAPHQHASEPQADLEDETLSTEAYHDAPDIPSDLTLPQSWMDGVIVSEESGLSALGDGPPFSKPSTNSPIATPKKKKPRQFPLEIPKPSFNFIPKESIDAQKQPTESKSTLPKMGGKTKSDSPAKPTTTKKLRFSTVVHSIMPPTRRRITRIPLGRKKSDGSKKSSLAGPRPGEISPLTTTEPGSSFVLPPFVEPTDVPAERRDAPGSAPKPKPHKPSKFFFKPNKDIPLSPLSPTSVSPVPGQPYEHIPSPEEPDPHKKLHIGRFEKVKGCFQRGIRQWRKFTLRKSVLQIILGRQLAGPVAANLKVLAGRKMVLEGEPGTTLWGIADIGLGERSLSGRVVK